MMQEEAFMRKEGSWDFDRSVSDAWQDKAYEASEKYKERKAVVEIAYITRVSRSPIRAATPTSDTD